MADGAWVHSIVSGSTSAAVDDGYARIEEHLPKYLADLAGTKSRLRHVDWYPFDILSCLHHMRSGFSGEGRRLFDLTRAGARVADIGAADGDLAFLLSDLGCEVTIIDNAPTNYNRCTGIKTLCQALDPRVSLVELDLDFDNGALGEFDVAFFLGTLYHLRNPMRALLALAESAEYMVLSTAVISYVGATNVEDCEIAALLPPRLRNNDPTNYWYMTPRSLALTLQRSGWTVLDQFRIGDVGLACPLAGDERMFVFCRRSPDWRQLRTHHDF